MIPIVQMRYSYFGQSGWRSDTSKSKELLFDPKRLQHRFKLLQQFAVNSLVMQEDQYFHFVMLTSSEIPQDHLREVRDFVGDSFGDRGAVIGASEGPVAQHYLTHCRSFLPNDTVLMQIVLDDDDALSTDFIGKLRQEAGAFRDRLPPDMRRFFVSFSKGVSVVYEKGSPVPKLYRRDVPYTNLGLALVSDISDRVSPYAVAHKKVARRFATLVYNDLKPYYLRVVHGANDSRALVDEAQPVSDAEMPELLERFPMMKQVMNPPKRRVKV